MRLPSVTGLRRSTALAATAAGLASVAALAAPASASAATPAPASAHQAHVAHQAHLHHLHVLHIAHANTAAREAANTAARAEQARLHRLHIARLNTQARVAAHEAAQAASRSAERSVLAPVTDTSPSGVRALARTMVPADQWAAFDAIVTHESDWNFRATNASSGAYGLVQALPGSKMASVASDWRTNPATQIRWGLAYMNERYGSPNAAWAFWQTHHWY
ncbi:lytic transglycosylase domain-containing protein [Streptacidiphilus sp. ASG 303]|uniref:aggregation-promoting factor C-terminal-like domain-containing protein n=1 Tax=Streptacidiphilus sp. ASG 303 TaxID=2896847 RepID=UPI001E4E186B|nr:transglycosylase SLT domain-containing protein [Streptacidiphilus sp. ASG 303]MCD0481465.1 lytic transglycosylase domain-containing protein [Streptacidiphilus sp. ASG 303]